MEEQSLIEQAEKAAARIEAANKQMEEIVKRQEVLEAKRLLGGKSEAGKNVEISEEEKLATDMKNYFKGTALDRAFAKYFESKQKK